MTWPQVTVNQLNLQQGEINETERTLLFTGASEKGAGTLFFVNALTDLAEKVSPGPLLNDLRAAQLNGGQNWQAWVSPLAEMADWADAVRAAQASVSVEGIVLSDDISDKATITQAAALRAEITAKHGRWCWFILATSGLLTETQEPLWKGAEDNLAAETWAEYVVRLTSLQAGANAYAVQLVPRIAGFEPGMLAGRLCNRSVTIADSPARVKTGPLIMPDAVDWPVDADGVRLELSTLQALEMSRYSVPMTYADYDGIFWSDGRTLDAEGGDYQSIENVRIADKAARRVRLMAIAKIADRSLNSTPASIAANESYFSRPLREMSRSMQINGVMFPGEVKPPQEGDIKIMWETPKKVVVGMIVRPYEVPLQIVVNIALDTTLEASA